MVRCVELRQRKVLFIPLEIKLLYIPLHIMEANGIQEYFPLHEKHVTLKLKAFLERNRCLLETVPTNIKYFGLEF